MCTAIGGQESYFLATNRGVKIILELKTLPKKFKSSSIDNIKIVKYIELTDRMRRKPNKYKHRKTLASAVFHMPLYSANV